MKTIAFIPARCGSVSIKMKNIVDFCGKPLIFWVLNELQSTQEIDEVVVATDCNEISDVVEHFNLSKVKIYRRLPENASNTASTESVMLEFIQRNDIPLETVFMLVQATSPLTSSNDFSASLKLYQTNTYDSILSCAESKRFYWDENGTALNYDFKNRPRRQDFKGQYIENGAFYINTVKNILTNKNRLYGKIGIYKMPEYTSIEIDEEHDFMTAELLMKKYRIKRYPVSWDIKLFLTDIDGTLTDGGMYYSENGDELKKFSTHDGKGFELLRNRGILTGVITSENRQLNRMRASKLKLDYSFHDILNKLDTVTELCSKLGISLNHVAYIGDDLNDFDLLSKVGVAACPSNAVEKIKAIPNIIILHKKSGKGAVREFAEFFL